MPPVSTWVETSATVQVRWWKRAKPFRDKLKRQMLSIVTLTWMIWWRLVCSTSRFGVFVFFQELFSPLLFVYIHGRNLLPTNDWMQHSQFVPICKYSYTYGHGYMLVRICRKKYKLCSNVFQPAIHLVSIPCIICMESVRRMYPY